MKEFELHLIVGMAEDGGIGLNGDMPWKRGLPADLKHFKETTMGSPIIMGRHTFESFPNGALPGRTNIVVTRNKDYSAKDIVLAHSLEEAIEIAANESPRAYLSGGGQLYKQALEKDLVQVLHITQVHHTWQEADTYMPAIDLDLWDFVYEERHEADEKNLYPYSFLRFERKSDR
ncbi:MAG: dihydrofolate reductase [Porphyromonas sp.]|nr:dihydrofolate reductase [Porphyromonas sp.]